MRRRVNICDEQGKIIKERLCLEADRKKVDNGKFTKERKQQTWSGDWKIKGVLCDS